jgi:hypothetical protein
MTKKELEIMICALEMYYKMQSKSDELDLKDKVELIDCISKLKLKVYKELRDKLSLKHID